jgi:hypothetical protein
VAHKVFNLSQKRSSVLKKSRAERLVAQNKTKTPTNSGKTTPKLVISALNRSQKWGEGFLNSAPWPLLGHPEAMKMDPSP